MRFKMIAVLGVAFALSASPAFALGGGGGSDEAAASSGSSSSSGGSGTVASDTTGSVAVTSEPLALFAVGLGLLGARYLRRR